MVVKETGVSFNPGTYTAKEYGNNDYIDVEVVDDSKIVSVSIKDSSETKHIGDVAIQSISKDIVDHQTLNVDSISGATV